MDGKKTDPRPLLELRQPESITMIRLFDFRFRKCSLATCLVRNDLKDYNSKFRKFRKCTSSHERLPDENRIGIVLQYEKHDPREEMQHVKKFLPNFQRRNKRSRRCRPCTA